MSEIDARVRALVAELPIEAKVAQLGGSTLPPLRDADEGEWRSALRASIPHGVGEVSADLPAFQCWPPEQLARGVEIVQRFLIEETPGRIRAFVHAEALNGFTYGPAVQFPTAIGLASSFDPEHVREAAATAARQMSALGINRALSPVLDVARDARWGRVHETYGEDPTLCAAMGVAYVQGMHEHPVRATGKHFLAYALSEGGLNVGPVQVGARELREVFAAPFEAAIRHGGLACVMNSYAAIDGIPVAASHALLTDLLRGELGFRGIVVADYGSVGHLFELHHVARDLVDAGVQSLEAGLDIELPEPKCRAGLVNALKDGLVEEDLIDQVCARVLQAKLEDGLLDAADAPFSVSVGERFAATGEECESSARAADDSLVLLQNDGLLPLSATTSSIAVIGPFADGLRPFFGCYSPPAALELTRYFDLGGEHGMVGVGEDAPTVGARRQRLIGGDVVEADTRNLYPDSPTIRQALEEVSPRGVVVTSVRGCDHIDDADADLDAAVRLARGADVIVCALGEKTGWVDDATAGEGKDRATLQLLGRQRELVEALAATGRPIVAVLLCGRPLEIEWLTKVARAIVCAWHPGPFGGLAIARALWGEMNPGGKLPISFPRTVGQAPIYHSHRLGGGYRRTANFAPAHDYVDLADSSPLFAFGHGLSYTTFELGEVRLPAASVRPGDHASLSALVTNTGTRAGDAVIQCYAALRGASVTRPARQLVGFRRVGLNAGEAKRVSFEIDTSQFALWDRQGRWTVEPGPIDLFLGFSSEDTVVSETLVLDGSPRTLQFRTAFYASSTVEPA